jgi:hypothetical protein
VNIEEQKSSALEMLYLLYFRELSAEAFEDWLLRNSWTEDLLGTTAYLEFMELNSANDSFEFRELARLNFSKLCQVDIFLVRALAMCMRSLMGTLQLDDACAELARLSLDGCDAIPSVFVGYHDELVRSKGEFLAFYRTRIESDMRQLQSKLQNETACGPMLKNWFD